VAVVRSAAVVARAVVVVAADRPCSAAADRLERPTMFPSQKRGLMQ
jgi:hypothetical protein